LADAPQPFTLETFVTSDGYPLRYRRYTPDSPPRAHVVAIHGIQSHAGWYTHSCERLCQAGFAVTFLDRRGSGINMQDRGDAPGFRRLLEDLSEFLRTQRGSAVFSAGSAGSGDSSQVPPKGHPTPFVFLLAISWGGKLGVALQRYHPGLIDGLALLCPGFFPKVRPAPREKLRILWARLIAPRRFFPIPLNDAALFTAVPRWQQFIRDDPLALRHATARLLMESARLDGYVKFLSRPVTMPVLLMLAEHDRIIDNIPTRQFIERFAAGERLIIEYPGAHHTLEFEPDPEKFISDLIHWLRSHSGG
jgi:alpha-beta hydrolase superfamily lysophospholipase